MATVFAVFKKGVYRHECGGIFSTIELATEAAHKLITGERDDYHTYEILEFELDVVLSQSPIDTYVKAQYTGERLMSLMHC